MLLAGRVKMIHERNIPLANTPILNLVNLQVIVSGGKLIEQLPLES